MSKKTNAQYDSEVEAAGQAANTLARIEVSLEAQSEHLESIADSLKSIRDAIHDLALVLSEGK